MSKKRKRGPYRRYTVEQKREAVELAQRIGPCGAAAQLGLPIPNVSRWVEAAPAGGVQSQEEGAGEVRTKRAARCYSPSQKGEILEYAAKHGVSEARKKHGASRFAIYDWRRKLSSALAGKGESPTSGEDPRTVEDPPPLRRPRLLPAA